jgi:hypothetical protein
MSNSERVQEILKANDLDFTIQKEALLDSKGRTTPYFGLFNSKTDECINTVKDTYSVSQNDEIVELVLRGMESFGSDLEVSKAGSLNGGRKVFIQLAIEGDGIVANDRIKRYVTIIDSNDGSTSLSIGIGDLTMSCSNQFAKFYKQGEAKFRHSSSLASKLKTIPSLIELALSQSLRQMELYSRFASTEITRDLAHRMVKHVLGFDREFTSMDELSSKSSRSINIMDKLYNHIDREIEDKGQNAWGLHSGITSFTTHEISVPKRDNGRVESVLNGSAYKMNQSSLEFVTRESGILVMA